MKSSVIGYEIGHGVPNGWSDVMLDWFEAVNALDQSAASTNPIT
ncbi:hypothetical protein [Ruegeria sp. THAF33]|nr:hypothetical protein [Ruegeria sp. THAF33]